MRQNVSLFVSCQVVPHSSHHCGYIEYFDTGLVRLFLDINYIKYNKKYCHLLIRRRQNEFYHLRVVCQNFFLQNISMIYHL